MIETGLKRSRLLSATQYLHWSYLPVGISIFIGIGLSTVAAVMVSQSERKSTQAQFERQADSLVHAIQQNLDRYESATRYLGGLYDISKAVDSEDFRLFAQNILPYHTSIQKVGWARQVTNSQRKTFEQQLASQKVSNFQISELNEAGTKISAASRSEYLPIAYTEPKELEQQLNYDLLSNPRHRAAIEKAKATSTMTIARSPFENSELGPTLVIYKPVYQKNLQQSNLDNFPQSFRGVVYIIFELKKMVETSLKELKLNRLNFFIYDTSLDQLQSLLMKPSLDRKEHLLVAYDPRKKEVTQPDRGITIPSCPYDREWFTCLRTLNIAGKEWSVLILPSSQLDVNISAPLSALAIGLAFTSSLGIYLWLSVKHNRETERLIAALRQIVHQTK